MERLDERTTKTRILGTRVVLFTGMTRDMCKVKGTMESDLIKGDLS